MEEDRASCCFWFSRFPFSKAFCHRTNTVVTPLPSRAEAPPFTVPEASQKKDSESGASCEGKAGWNDSSGPVDSVLEPSFSFRSPFSSRVSLSSLSSLNSKGPADVATSSDFSLPSRDEDYSSVTSSPRSCRSSFSSQSNYFSGRYSTSEDCREAGHNSDVKRVPSWSDLFRHAGDERAVSSIEKWMIDLSQLFLGQRFACSTYSRLYHGKYKDEVVAVKVMRQPDEDEFMSERLERLFTQEITLHSSLSHKNIVKFIGACKKPPALCMVMEYLPGGSLRAFLHKGNEPLPVKQLLGMAFDIASGMEYLHTSGLVHRDLKSENLLLTGDFRVKIGDFGIASYEPDCDLMRNDPGTYRWMAPEMVSRKPCSRKVDVFSFGMILYELLSRRVPFEEISAVQATFAIVHKNERPEIPSHCPLVLEKLIRRCWSPDPNQRPEFWEILKSLQDLMDDIDDEMVISRNM